MVYNQQRANCAQQSPWPRSAAKKLCLKNQSPIFKRWANVSQGEASGRLEAQ